MNSVKIGVIPGRIEEVMLEEGTTVERAIEIAELNVEGHTITLNGVPAELERVLTEGDRVLLSRQIKGN